MSKAVFAFALAGVCLVSTPVYADKVDLGLEAFHQNCLAHGPDFERTVAVAKTRGWTPLSGDAALAPVDDVNAFQGWAVTGNDLPAGTIIAVTKANLNGKAVQTCSIRLFDVDRATFEQRFFARTDAEKISEDRNGDQVTKLYILVAGNRKQLVHLTSPVDTERTNSIIASSIADD
ncbi:hypothetical protein NKI54_00135 [Mesorhizobium sp. M0663]|uniref:hypothetical protein n=1 Tax=unclassified Mesorhizobium TaxID=325217 RepID=UPI00333AD6E9